MDMFDCIFNIQTYRNTLLLFTALFQCSCVAKYFHVRTVFTFSTMFPGTRNTFLASYSPKFALCFQRSFYLNCEQNIAYVNKYFI